MPTIRQRRAFDKIVENGRSVSAAMREVGYSKNTAIVPQKLTESKGFKELCEEVGLTDNLLVKALVQDIKKKKGNRKAELELGFKVKGRLKEEDDKPQIQNNFFILNDEQRQAIARRIVARDRRSEESSR